MTKLVLAGTWGENGAGHAGEVLDSGAGLGPTPGRQCPGVSTSRD